MVYSQIVFIVLSYVIFICYSDFDFERLLLNAAFGNNYCNFTFVQELIGLCPGTQIMHFVQLTCYLVIKSEILNQLG